LRSTLVINDILNSENVIVVEVSKLIGISYIAPKGSGVALFEVFDNIKKLNDNLFHFGKCTQVAHNSEERVIALIRNSVIYISVYLRVKSKIVSGKDVIFYITKKHGGAYKDAILVAAITLSLDEPQSVRLHGKLNIEASEDLVLCVFSTGSFHFNIMDKSVFTMYEA